MRKLSLGRPKGGIWYDSEGDPMATADHVVDDPRQPRLIPTGVLDANGEMLVRVYLPIKCRLGFHIPNERDVEDEVLMILPESQISIAEDMPGSGYGHIEDSEIGYDDDEP